MDDALLPMRKAPAGERLNAAPVEPARAPAAPHQGDPVSVYNVEPEPLDAIWANTPDSNRRMRKTARPVVWEAR